MARFMARGATSWAIMQTKLSKTQDILVYRPTEIDPTIHIDRRLKQLLKL
jgi:hypothetical protein